MPGEPSKQRLKKNPVACRAAIPPSPSAELIARKAAQLHSIQAVHPLWRKEIVFGLTSSFLFSEPLCLTVLILPGTRTLERNVNTHAYSSFFCKSSCPSCESCVCVGRSISYPACPAQLRPIPGLLLEASDLCAVGLLQRLRSCLAPTGGAGSRPCRAGHLRGQFCLSQPECAGAPLGTSPCSRNPSLLPKDTSWPLIRVSYALLTVNMAFVPLMGVCCCKAGGVNPGQ